MNERKSFQRYNISINETSEFFQQNDMKKLNRVSSKRFKNFKNKKGITLIALVISIIVMLILAGVSLNATIGDNGIITQAQNATYMQSIAVLEEYLNNYYVENYEEFESIDNKAEALQKNYESENWIYNPSKNGYGSVSYIVNNNGQACYLINKNALPEEIKNQLKGGDAGDGTYASYVGMIDVYGITSDLKVYYSNDGIENIKGISESELDLDNPARLVFAAGSNYAKLITGDSTKSVTANDCKSIKTLTIDSTSGINNLNELYNFASLEELNLKDLQLENLVGIQNVVNLKTVTMKNCKTQNLDGLYSARGSLNFIMFEQCEIENYKSLSNLSELKYLYLMKTTNNEINKLCSNDLGIGDTNFDKLTNFGILGSSSVLSWETRVDFNTRNTNVTDISVLNNLSVVTKESIQYLFLNNNNITNLNNLSGFKNVLHLHCETNKLENLNGIENMQKLTQIYASNNLLGNLESNSEKSDVDGIKALENITTLESVDFRTNSIIWIDYIKNCNKIDTLFLSQNTRLNSDSLLNIKNICIQCGNNFNISNNYSLLLLDEKTELLNLSWQTISENNFKLISSATNLKYLNLEGMKLKDESDNNISREKANKIYNDVLSNFKKLNKVNLSSLGNDLTTLEFIRKGEITTITELELYNTKVTTGTKNESNELVGLEVLNDYCNKIGNLEISEKNIDLSKIQPTIEKLYENASLGYWKNNTFSGLCCYDSDIVKTLEKCYNITSFSLYAKSINLGNINLENCKSLTKILLNSVNGKIKLPSNDFEKISCWSVNDIFDFSNVGNIDFFKIQAQNETNFKNIINTLPKDCIINDMELYQNCSGTNFSCFKNCKTINIKIINAFWDTNCGTNSQTTNVSGLRNITNLNQLSIDGRAYTNLSNIDDLDSLINLKFFTSTKTCINSLYGLRNLTNLSYLNLSNNCIFERANNSDGEIINNLQILANLNPGVNHNGNLTSLYMSGNTGIINWDILKNLSWPGGKSGF